MQSKNDSFFKSFGYIVRGLFYNPAQHLSLQKNRTPLKFHEGFILPISLIFLVILTLLGITAMVVNVYEQRISANLQDKNRSFEASEMGIKLGENWLNSLIIPPIALSLCSTSPCVLQQDPERYPEMLTLAWWQQNAASGNTMTDTAAAPLYVVEFNQFIPDDATIGFGYNQQGTYIYRVTSSGTGHTAQSQTFIQSNMGRRF